MSADRPYPGARDLSPDKLPGTNALRNTGHKLDLIAGREAARGPEDGGVRAAELPPEAVAAAERLAMARRGRLASVRDRACIRARRPARLAPRAHSLKPGGTFAPRDGPRARGAL